MQLASVAETQTLPRAIRRATAATCLLMMSLANGIGSAAAQSMFAPAITVNEDAITYFELDQREQFLRVLGIPGDPVKMAREALIDERLQRQAANTAGVSIPPEDVTVGLEEFAASGNLPLDEFTAALAEAGIAPETAQDFVASRLLWRQLIQSRFLSRARPTDDEIDRALGRSGTGGVRVLLSEIIIPVTPQTADQVSALAENLSQITSISAFSAEAERYSATDTRTRGGRMDWMPIGNLPPALQPVILGLGPGEVTTPIPLPNAIALFQLRDIEESGSLAPAYSAIEYAIYLIPGGRSPEALAKAAEVRARVDSCNDLYGVALGQPPEFLERVSQPPREIPRDIAIELAKLDAGEMSTALTRNNGQVLALLMLCGRTAELNENASREEVANALAQRRLAEFADSYLEQLRANALIVEK